MLGQLLGLRLQLPEALLQLEQLSAQLDLPVLGLLSKAAPAQCAAWPSQGCDQRISEQVNQVKLPWRAC